MKIFFDLDGTLLDSKRRLYLLFQFLVPESKFTFEIYWKLKQDKVSHRELLAKYFDYTEEDFYKFNTQWMSLIESPAWLLHDQLFDGIKPFLWLLKERNELYLVTARQSEEATLRQIEDVSLGGIFNDVLVTFQKTEKQDLIRSKCELSSNDWIIGDTGKDIEAGKKLGIKTAAVLSGFLNKKRLIAYNPDIIIDSVTNFNLI